MNARTISLIAVALPLVGACAAGTSTNRASAARVDSIFAANVPAGAPGCAVGVYRDGKLLLANGYGVANLENGRAITPNTTFNLGSVSKQFTALAVLMLEQQGRLTLGDDVRRYIPELRDYGTAIRIRDLLQHTSGLRDYGTLERFSGRDIASMAEFVGLMAGQRSLNFVPGTRHEYSHSDFELLGLVVERLTKEPFRRHLERTIFEPLGMTATHVYDGSTTETHERAYGHIKSPAGYVVQFPSSRLIGGVNVYTSVTDLQRWAQNFADAKVGGRAVIDRMLTLPILPNGDTIPYAFGVRLDKHRGLPIVTRGGSANGSRTEIIRFPTQRFTVTTLCNGSHLPPGTLGEAVAEVYIGDAMQPLPARTADAAAAPVPIAQAELARYAGVYSESAADVWDAVRMELRDGKFIEILGDTFQTFTHVGNGKFSGDGSPGFFHTITLAGPGQRARLETSWGGEVHSTGVRVDDSELWRPTATQLAEYAGRYFSEDIDVAWQLVQREGNLVLRRRGTKDLALVPVRRDTFERYFGDWDNLLATRIQFSRDGADRIAHFTVSTRPGEDAVNELRFDRVGTR